jgi:hypothetical protein
MNATILGQTLVLLGFVFMISGAPLEARIKLAALPERATTIIRLDHPAATLIEEERVLTLQKGLNQVDFSWKGVSIDEDSIRLALLGRGDKASLLSVSYPPNESALVWEIHSQEAFQVNARISYLLSNIDKLIAYKGLVDKAEGRMDLKAYLILRNFSGEDFDKVSVMLDQDRALEQEIRHEETKQLLYFSKGAVPIRKVWTWDGAVHPWDPRTLDANVGIPVTYRIRNTKDSGLGSHALIGGKCRVFQEDGHGSTIFLGEDVIGLVPVGEEMRILIGDSRDIVVTQRTMAESRINVRRNKNNKVVLYDTDETIQTTIENFKEHPAVLTLLQHIPGQWDMETCNKTYKLKEASTLEFEIPLTARGKETLVMRYHRRNVR